MAKLIVVAILMLATYGCSGSSSETAQDSEIEPDAATETRDAESGTRDEQAETPGEEPEVRMLTVPAGHPLLVELQTELSTEASSAGSLFSAVLLEPVLTEGVEVAPAGARVTGAITRLVTPSEDARAGMTLELTHLQSHAVETRSLDLKAEGSTGGDLEKVAAGGVAGGVIGGILGGKKGAAVGAGVGAGAGVAIAVATRDDHIRLAAGQKMRFELSRPLGIERTSL